MEASAYFEGPTAKFRNYFGNKKYFGNYFHFPSLKMGIKLIPQTP